jgi:hypothetical protein
VSDHTAEVLEQVAEERARQIELGWRSEHDDRWGVHRLVALAEKRAHRENDDNPGYYSRDQLVQATALMVAAIERLDRSEVGN